MGAKILVIDDEIEIRRLLKVGLTAHGYDVVEAANAQDGIYQAATVRPDILILDMGLPDLEGLEVVRQVREWSHIPIIILSVRGQDQDKVKALDLGADDYLTKPFSMSELMARIRVALRHQANLKDEPVIIIGDLYIDLSRRLVKVIDTEVHLTPTEYDLLKILVSNAGRVVTHRHLITSIWGSDGQEYSQYLRIYISQLRKKIETDPNQPKFILTEPGVGYRIAVLE
ncbi:MAG TPA: response regulator [Syntrophomonadaceae bacterium]|nr:response regulator [Syntrophomonadaceae bacterium]